MKKDLFSISEALKIFNSMRDQKFNDGLLALKIFDTVDILSKKALFLEEEIGKIISEYKAEAADPENGDYRMVVKNDDTSPNDEKTKEFLDSVVAIRKTEVEIEFEPFTPDEIEKITKTYSLSPAELGQIRFMIERKPKEPDAEPEAE